MVSITIINIKLNMIFFLIYNNFAIYAFVNQQINWKWRNKTYPNIYIYIYKDEQTHTLDSDFNAILVFIIPKEHKISVRLQKMNTSMHNFKILMLFQCSYFGARS